MKKNIYSIVMVSLLSISAACGSITPYENSVMTMRSAIGRSSDDSSNVGWGRPDRLIERETLRNGNIEEAYRFSNSCRYFYEIDSAKRAIVG